MEKMPPKKCKCKSSLVKSTAAALIEWPGPQQQQNTQIHKHYRWFEAC